MRRRWWLWLVLSGCTATDPRPFGVEASTVTVAQGSIAVVGFRVTKPDGGMVPPVTVTPPGELRASLASLVAEDDAFAGGVFLVTDFATAPGVYVVTFGGQTITATVGDFPVANNSPQTTRRSTVAQLDHAYTSIGQLSVLAEDGTVWKLMPDAGVERLEGLSGLRAITAGPNESLATASLDGPVVDLRGTQGGTVELLADGSARQAGYPSLQGVSAVRPNFFGGPAQSNVVLTLKNDGTVSGVSQTSRIRAAIDLVPGGETFLRADGVVYEAVRGQAAAYAPVFSFPGLRAFEGSAYETYSGQTAEYRHQALWATPDGTTWFMGSEKNPVPLAPPDGVEFVDVFARGRGAYALGDDKRLYDVTGGGTPVRLPFENVRGSAPRADAAVFCDPIRVRPGQSVTVPLRVVRDGYDGALLLTPRGLSADLTAAPVSIPAQATTASLQLTLTPDSTPRPQILEFALTGEGLARTTMLPVELAPSPRRITVSKDLVVKTDGSVWRFTPAPAVQVAGLSNIVSVTDNMALDANGVVYSFGENGFGQLGRGTRGVNDPTPAPVAGLPPIVAIAHSVYQVNLSLALDRDGRVWQFGAESTNDPGRVTPTQIMNIDPMVDISADGSPSGLDAAGNAWNLQGSISGILGGRYGRMGVRYGASGGKFITPQGFIDNVPHVLWYTTWATLTEGRGVGRLGIDSVGVIADSQGSVYATAEGVTVKQDGTLWKVSGPSQDRLEALGVTGVALPR